MNWNLKMFGQTVAFTMAASSIVASGKTGQEMGMEACQPTPPAPCYSIDTPPCDYCFGPENVSGNPAVRPYTCDGDYVFTIAGFCWNAHEDGLGFAIENNASASASNPINRNPNVLIHAEVINPNFKWDLGWKLGFGYNSTRSGWDIGAVWTSYDGKAKANPEADRDDNKVLLPLYSDFVAGGSPNPILMASSINAHWKLKLNMVDLELGREFWNSKYLTIRPHAGLRFLWIDQTYKIEHRGQSWGPIALPQISGLNDFSSMHNHFKGIGVRAGIDTQWLLGNGWSLFGNAAYSLIYGRFNIGQCEYVREALAPFDRIDILETEDHYRSTKAATDLALGVQYSTMFNDCKNSFQLSLAWEHHLFFNQNQLWRVNRVGVFSTASNIPNNAGENIFIKGRGDLSTQGWTLTARFEF